MGVLVRRALLFWALIFGNSHMDPKQSGPSYKDAKTGPLICGNAHVSPGDLGLYGVSAEFPLEI